ncbi:GntR family transcriptional regulator [Paenarthrobacter nitroguajacolicus]|uniref:GntR family transcriptional regulator n=1 Tax=Paenarthrobacter nitroguajacolicus TaxID=211146 RepID=A0A558GYH7_PAENT|nr:GntR family transcriptional regulator [Paenarthrobacter nitroguajacolicus]TVU61944.1 GntR family transcriptional regulator [Paenarthrobacter nitroguajacolicus]
MERVKRLPAITPESTGSAEIADKVRELILTGHFTPGEQVNEVHLASQLNLSRTPLREALQRLSQEGLLTGKRNRGLFMIELTKDDVGEIYRTRELLELTAAETITSRSAKRRQEVSARLVKIAMLLPEATAARDWASICRLDLRFHTKLVAEAGNSRLFRAYTTLAAESLICMRDLEGSYPTPGAWRDDHLAIAGMIASGSMDEVRSVLRKHLSAP